MLLLPPGDEDGNEFVAAFADLAADVFAVEFKAETAEGCLPCLGVKPVALDEGSVDITQESFDHGWERLRGKGTWMQDEMGWAG